MNRALLEVPTPTHPYPTLENFALMGDATNRSTQQRALVIGRRYCADWPNVVPLTVLRGPLLGRLEHWCVAIARWLAEHHLATVTVIRLAILRASDEVAAYSSASAFLAITADDGPLEAAQSGRLDRVLTEREQAGRPTVFASTACETTIGRLIGLRTWIGLRSRGGIVVLEGWPTPGTPKGATT